MKVGLSNSAFSDLEAILDYYTQEGVPDVGHRFVQAIIERVQALSDHPDMGRVVLEFQSNDIREIIHGPFRVVYLREEKSVTVIRVWRSERLLLLPEDN
jgi:toxin ParE1/3/4